jgi:cis-3-alkyl-4-acyloxetan-2-one decarboxylase
VRFPDYDFPSHYLDLDGLRLHYLDEGPRAGLPVLMVHGNPTWSFFFRSLIHATRENYRVVVPDHIGMGLSDKPGDERYPFRLDRRIDDLERLLDATEVRSEITLVVHDWGGMIGLGYALRHPGRIARLVILNTASFHPPPGTRFPPDLSLVRTPWLGSLLVCGLNAFARTAVRRCITTRMAPAVRQAYLAPYDSWANRRAILRFVEDIPVRPADSGYDLVSHVEAALPQMFAAVPVLICWGMRDFIFEPAYLTRWRQLLPHAEVHEYAAAGHYLLEDAGALVAGKLTEFLARTPPDTAPGVPTTL